MNILLVYPKFPKSYWSFHYAIAIEGTKALLPPLGLLTVGAMLPKGWVKRLVDMNVQELTEGDLGWADYVFLSGMAVQRESAHEVTAKCKAMGKKLIAGGPLMQGEYATFEDVDHFCLSEGELCIKQLVADMEKGAVKRIYRSRETANMHESPVPLWELVDMSKYNTMCIQYTRGCPYDCDFCNVTALLGREPRTKKSEQIIAELDYLHSLGWRGQVFFVDDNLIGNRPAAKKDLLPALAKWQREKGPIPFLTQLTVNLADDPALVEQVAKAGFNTVFVGIETTNADALKECNKSQNRKRDLAENVHALQRAGIEVQAGFIVGFDSDTDDAFRNQVEFIQRSGIVTAMVGMLQAPLGTRLLSRMAQEGRLRGHSTGNNTDGSTNIEPKMGREKLRSGYLWLLENIYSPRPAYERIRTFLEHFRKPQVSPQRTERSLRTFLRSIWVLGVCGEERWEYWKLLFWTLRRCREHFAWAVKMAVIMHHCRRVWEEIASRPEVRPLQLVDNHLVAEGEERVNLTVSASRRVVARAW